MNKTKTTKRYVDDNLLGEGVLFRSCIGQRMGFSNTKISTYVNFGKDRLRIGVMPQHYQGRKEILYKDISSVTTKRYVNAYVIVLLVLFAIMSIFTAGTTLIAAAVIFWAGFGSKLEIATKDGYTAIIYSAAAPSHYQDFITALQTAMANANQENEIVSQDMGENILSRSIDQRTTDLQKSCAKTWDVTVDALSKETTVEELLQQIDATVQNDSICGTAGQSTAFYQAALQKLAPHLLAGETVLLCYNVAVMSSDAKKFMALTDQRVLFYHDQTVEGTFYGNLVTLSYLPTLGNQWVVDDFMTASNRFISEKKGNSMQMGLIFALIITYFDQCKNPGDKIIVRNADSYSLNSF